MKSARVIDVFRSILNRWLYASIFSVLHSCFLCHKCRDPGEKKSFLTSKTGNQWARLPKVDTEDKSHDLCIVFFKSGIWELACKYLRKLLVATAVRIPWVFLYVKLTEDKSSQGVVTTCSRNLVRGYPIACIVYLMVLLFSYSGESLWIITLNICQYWNISLFLPPAPSHITLVYIQWNGHFC